MISFKNILESSKYFWINTFKGMANINYETTRKESSFEKKKVKPIKMAFSVIGKDAKSSSKIDKYPIIVMHGLFGSRVNWNSLANIFHTETNKKVYLVDARNHGDSPHVNEHSYFHLAEDINLFMSDNNIEKAALIGHSMGGRAVMLFSFLYSKKVESLTVVDISPIGTSNSMKEINKLFFAIKNVKLDNKLTLTVGRNLAIAQLTESTKSKTLANFLSMNLAKTESDEFYWKVNVNTLSKIFHPHVTTFPKQEGKYYGPTIFICGAKSDFVNFDDIDKIKNLFPNANFLKIENAGHWIHVEQPKQLSDMTCKFIKSSI